MDGIFEHLQYINSWPCHQAGLDYQSLNYCRDWDILWENTRQCFQEGCIFSYVLFLCERKGLGESWDFHGKTTVFRPASKYSHVQWETNFSFKYNQQQLPRSTLSRNLRSSKAKNADDLNWA